MQVLLPASSKTLSVSATSTATAGAALPGLGTTVRVVNEGPNNAYFAVGASTVAATVPTGTAAVTCTPVLAGEDVVFSRGDSETYISAITRANQTATLIVQTGEGQ